MISYRTKLHRSASSLVIVLCCIIFPQFDCHALNKLEKALILSDPLRRAENFTFDADSPVHSRISPASETVLAELQQAEGHTDHQPYLPTDAEVRLFKSFIEKLPPRCKSVIQKRLLAIYFIDGLHVGGGTHWVLDDKGEIYAYMTINRRTFDLSISEFLTLKEKTVYSREPSRHAVEIDVSGNQKCLLYILIHESIHLVDFVDRITPYAETLLNDLQESDVYETPFTEDIWWQFDQPIREFRFKLLSQVEFYSSEAAGAIPLSDARRLYRSLDDTPFASLYSCVNWSEDLAEAITMRHLSEELGLSYKISIRKDGEEIFKSQPLEKALFKERYLPLEEFYR